MDEFIRVQGVLSLPLAIASSLFLPFILLSVRVLDLSSNGMAYFTPGNYLLRYSIAECEEQNFLR